MSALQKAKREIEQELERRSARIDGTVARLKSDFSLPGFGLGRLARSHPYQSLFGLVAVGAAAAFLLLNRSGGKSAKSTRTGSGLADAYADVIAAGIRDAEKRGESKKEALRSAVRANPPVILPPEQAAPPTQVKQVTDRFVSTITAMAFDYATGWLSKFLNRRNSTT